MQIEPKTVNIKENYKSWLTEAYFLFSEKIITLIFISSLYIASFYFLTNASKENALCLIFILIVYKYILPTFFFYYACCLFYYADDNKPPISMALNKEGIIRFIGILILIDIIFISIILSIKLLLSPFAGSEMSSSANKYTSIYQTFLNNSDLLNSFEMFDKNIILLFLNIFLTSVFFCTVFFNFSIKKSFAWAYDATIYKNLFLLWLSFTPVFIWSFITTIVPVAYYSVIFIGPYILALIYVIIKHIFFGMAPTPKKILEKNYNYSSQTN